MNEHELVEKCTAFVLAIAFWALIIAAVVWLLHHPSEKSDCGGFIVGTEFVTTCDE